MISKPRTIDEYLAALSEDQRAALEKLRKTIRAAAPKAEECISYQVPAFRLNGMLVAFGATANHCAFYPMSSSTVAAHKDELKSYDTSKGTIRLQAGGPSRPPWCGSWSRLGSRRTAADNRMKRASLMTLPAHTKAKEVTGRSRSRDFARHTIRPVIHRAFVSGKSHALPAFRRFSFTPSERWQ